MRRAINTLFKMFQAKRSTTQKNLTKYYGNNNSDRPINYKGAKIGTSRERSLFPEN